MQLRAMKRVLGPPVDVAGAVKLLSASYIVPGCWAASWQSWHRFGTFSLRSFTVRAPCGLWQVKQTSCCGTREVFTSGAICGLVILSSVSRSPWVLWQFVQETSFLRCLPLSQKARWRLASWQVRQILSFSAAGIALAPGFTIPPTPRPPPASTCFVPSPWQLAQPALDAGERGCDLLPCTVPEGLLQ